MIAAALTERTLVQGVFELAQRDPDLARIHARWGVPPLWAREPGYPTLVRIILEQQVSLASAQAAYARLLAAVSPLTPEGFLAVDDVALKAIGFSHQKAGYARGLARSLQTGQLDLDSLAALDDEAVTGALVALKGIGRWSADIYLLMALRRPDAWPSSDLALAQAAQRAKRLKARPGPAALDAIGAAWRPWRAVAARMLWFDYLEGKP